MKLMKQQPVLRQAHRGLGDGPGAREPPADGRPVGEPAGARGHLRRHGQRHDQHPQHRPQAGKAAATLKKASKSVLVGCTVAALAFSRGVGGERSGL